MRTFAYWLRRLADRFDPPMSDPRPSRFIELVQVDGKEAGRIIANDVLRNQRGIPVFFWPIGHNGFRLWPLPEKTFQLGVRIDG